MEKVSREQKYQHMRETLNEKQWRQYLAMEAKDRGTIAEVASEAKVSRNTVKRGMRELEAGDIYQPGERIRKEGGGRKPLVQTDATLLSDLEGLLDPKGDPMSLVQWTSKSLSHLTKALEAKGHSIKKSALAELLHQRRFSLRANKKTIEGKGHPDRNAQFEHITGKCAAFTKQGNPIISVDCKKKELLGNFKNNGREWQAKGEDTCVNVYDFVSLADGKAVPYGVYDVVHKSGFVNVGIDHETAEFAVESIRRWWRSYGKELYPDKKEVLITADSGGSNGAKTRLWKKMLQQLANEEHLTITVAHYPPGASKWNKIEHQLFSFISINWRAKPLISLEVVIELISATTTEEGLTVAAIKDSHHYPTGIKVTDEEFAALHLLRDPFHGDWNYTIKPQVP
jgi:transposase